jgi:aldose 1-epimerase
VSGQGPTLRAGDLRVELAPRLGGAVRRFDRIVGDACQPLLRGPLEVACFPLVPFANRLRGGAFACDGRTVRLAPNMAGDPSPLHGQGWRAVWSAERLDERRAVLSFRHAAAEWPWDYEATQRIDLDDGGLSLTLSCVNVSAERMPCGLGYHPYYPCDADTVLDTAVERAWTVDADVLPLESVAAAGRYDLRNRRICGQSLDNGFDGWSGTASIRWPRAAVGLRLTSPDAGRLQVFSPPAGGVFAAEPAQNANTALNAPQRAWPDLGIVMLAKGEQAVLRVRFDITPT